MGFFTHILRDIGNSAWLKLFMMASIVAVITVSTAIPVGAAGGGKAHMLEIRPVQLKHERTVQVIVYGLEDGEQVRLSHECIGANSETPAKYPITLTYEPLQTAENQFIYGGVAIWDVHVDGNSTVKNQRCVFTAKQVVGGWYDERILYIITKFAGEHPNRYALHRPNAPNSQQIISGDLRGNLMTISWTLPPVGLWEAIDAGAQARFELVAFHNSKDGRERYSVTKLRAPATTMMYLDGKFVRVPTPTSLIWAQVDNDVKVCGSSGDMYLDIHYKWPGGKERSYRATIDC